MFLGKYYKVLNQFIIISLLTFFIIACSTTRLVIDNFEWLAVYYVDDIVDLSESQEKLFRLHLGTAINEIKSNEFSDYIDLLNDLNNGLNAETSLEQVDQFYAKYRIKRNDLIGIVIQVITPLCYQLTTEQIDRLYTGINQKKPDYIDEELSLSKAKQIELRAKRWVERLENWTGSLDDAQSEKIIALSQDIPNSQNLRQSYRNAKLKGFIKLLQQAEKQEAKIKQYLYDWMISRAGQPLALKQQKHLYEQKFPQFLYHINNVLNKDQRLSFKHKIKNYNADLSSVVASFSN